MSADEYRSPEYEEWLSEQACHGVFMGGYTFEEEAGAWAAWQASVDAGRYRKLQRWMASNVPEGWAEVEKLGGICAWMSMEDMDEALDALPVCSVGLCEVAPK